MDCMLADVHVFAANRMEQLLNHKLAIGAARVSALNANAAETCVEPEAMMWQGTPRKHRPRRWAHARWYR